MSFKRRAYDRQLSEPEAPAPLRWKIRYLLRATGETSIEEYETKQMARDRYFTVRQFKGLAFVEIRDTAGRVWFADHFFDEVRKCPPT